MKKYKIVYNPHLKKYFIKRRVFFIFWKFVRGYYGVMYSKKTSFGSLKSAQKKILWLEDRDKNDRFVEVNS